MLAELENETDEPIIDDRAVSNIEPRREKRDRVSKILLDDFAGSILFGRLFRTDQFKCNQFYSYKHDNLESLTTFDTTMLPATANRKTPRSI